MSALLDGDQWAVDMAAVLGGEEVRRKRWRLCLDLSLRELALSQAEASLVCDACNGTIWDEASWQAIWAEVADAIRLDGLADKWEVDGPALVQRLQAAPLAAKLALAEAVEEFWRAHTAEPTADALRAVGLAR